MLCAKFDTSGETDMHWNYKSPLTFPYMPRSATCSGNSPMLRMTGCRQPLGPYYQGAPVALETNKSGCLTAGGARSEASQSWHSHVNREGICTQHREVTSCSVTSFNLSPLLASENTLTMYICHTSGSDKKTPPSRPT